MKNTKKEEDIEDLLSFFASLADPTRLRLFKLLCRQQQPDALCVNALANLLGVTQSAVSQHLRVLRAAGLVKGERRGFRVHYFVHQAKLQRYQELISAVFHLHGQSATAKDSEG